MNRTIKGIHYKTLEHIQIEVENGNIKRIDRLSSEESGLPYIGPVLLDLQVNGYMGYDFNSERLTSDDVIKVSALLHEKGIGAYCPTIITNDIDFISERIKTIVKAVKEDSRTRKSIAGIHIEGPFISKEDGPRGAHPKEFVIEPNLEYVKSLESTAEGLLRILTLSPEWENADEIISYCRGRGIIAAIGHTAADSSQIHSAVTAGAELSTHLGNGAHGVLKRHPNYIWAQLAEDSLYASLIADGFHLPNDVLKVMMRVKGDRTILVSDSTIFAGMAAGDYQSVIGGSVVLSPENRLYMKESPEMLAGSASNLCDCVSYLIKEGICTAANAWEMASEIPAGLIQNEDYMLRSGSSSDLVLFDVEQEGIRIREVIRLS